jgi:hypothetical protein
MLNLFMQVPRLIRKRLAVRCKEVYRQCVLVDDVGDEAEEAEVLHTSKQVLWAVRAMLVYARVDCPAIHTHYLARNTSALLKVSQSRTVLPVVKLPFVNSISWRRVLLVSPFRPMLAHWTWGAWTSLLALWTASDRTCGGCLVCSPSYRSHCLAPLYGWP